MGQVWLAEHVALSVQVVVKILDPAHIDRKDLGDRMRLEAQALGRVRHPNVVSVIDGGRSEAGFPFLVMELLVGRTLHAELSERRTLPVPEALGLARQVLMGLAAVHAAGIVHRDVKLSNLFLCDLPPGAAPGTERQLKLIDFGIVKLVGNTAELRPLAFPTTEGAVLGTPSALSPEQARGKHVDHRTDLYAVGLLLHQALAGAHPFAGLSGARLIRAYTKQDPELLSRVATQEIPPALDAIVQKALRRDPTERFQSAEELIRAIDGLTRGEQSTEVVPDLAPSPGTAPEKAAELSTELLQSAEVRELNAQVGIAPRLRTDELPPTRTAIPPSSRAARRRFVAVSCLTAALVVSMLVVLLWR